MRCQVVTVVRRKGVGQASQKAYDFQAVGALIQTAQGVEFCEFMIDGMHAVPESGKTYEMDISFYPGKEKKLSMRVEALRPVAAAKVA